MLRVAVITDSTAMLPSKFLRRSGTIVVPVQVIIDGEALDEGTQVSSAQVAAALEADKNVTTSKPPPEHLLAAYLEAERSGAQEVVSIHLSSQLSGTYDSAVVAARQSPIPVEVVDSRRVAMGLGFAVEDAAAAAAAGADAREAGQVALASATASTMYFYVDTLEYLRRGGRIGAAQSLLGSVLAVKPILRLDDGIVAPFERVRTRSRALSRLKELAIEAAAAGPCRVAVQHLRADRRAAELAVALRHELPSTPLRIGDVGAVVGAHVGPGMVAVTISPASAVRPD